MSPNVLPFPVHIAGKGALSAAVLAGDKEARPPLFVRTRRGVGMLRRQCTRNFKLRPIRRVTRELLGKGPRDYIKPGSVEAWIGISLDEVFRMKPSGLRFITNRHPLIEKRLTRRDCLEWMASHGYPRPPKSSCWHCPYQTNAQWRDKRDNSPAEWRKAVEFDRAVRSPEIIKLYGAAGFVHPSAVPLDEADISDRADTAQLDLFNNECEGMCGV